MASPDEHLLPRFAQRFNWYNPMLDPRTQDLKMTQKMRKAADEGSYNDGSSQQGGRLCTPDEGHPYNLVSSLCRDGFHRPALDVDLPSHNAEQVRDWVESIAPNAGTAVVVPSTHNWHAYLPEMRLPWDEYEDLLVEMCSDGDGLLEVAYVEASIRRGQTLLRPPHILKGTH